MMVRAVRWLRVLGGPQAVAGLIGALDDGSPDIQAEAVRALGAMQAREAAPVLIGRFQSDRPVPDRAGAIQALAEGRDPRAVPPLVDALGEPEEWLVETACEALGALGDWRAVEPLLRLLAHPDWAVRHAASSALISLEVTDERLSAVLDQLARERDDPDDWFHLRGMKRELARLAGRGDEQQERQQDLERALAGLQDPDRDKRRWAATRLRDLGGPEAVTALLGALEDPDSRVRSRTALSLGCLEAPEALPALVEHLLHDPSPGVREMCVAFLNRFADERATAALRQALADTHQRVAQVAAIHLARSGDRTVIPAMLPLLDHPEWSDRFSAARVLLDLRVADRRLVTALEHLAREPEAEDHDLQVAEWNCDLPKWKELAEEGGDPEPEPQQTMAEMVEQARQLLAQGRP